MIDSPDFLVTFALLIILGFVRRVAKAVAIGVSQLWCRIRSFQIRIRKNRNRFLLELTWHVQ
jgi:hypothetical protein